MGPNPKMVSEEVSPKGSPNLFNAAAPNKVLSSNNAIYLGDCSPTKPFVFRIGSRAGRGALGSLCSSAPSISIRSDDRDVALDGDQQENFFAVDGGGVVPEEAFLWNHVGYCR